MQNSKQNIEENIEKNIEEIADKTKRDFMKKFGSYAASVPLAGFVLMTAETSLAARWSGMGNGNYGGGDD